MRTPNKRYRHVVAVDYDLHALVKQVCECQGVSMIDFTNRALKYYLNHAVTFKGRGKVFNAKNAQKQVSKVTINFEIPEGQLTEFIQSMYDILPHEDIEEDYDE